MPLGDVVEGVQLQGTPPSLPEAGKLVSGASPHTPDAADGERGEAAGLTSAAGHLWVIRSTHRSFSLICGTSELEQKPRDDQMGPSASRRVCALRRSSWPEVTCACPSVLAAPLPPLCALSQWSASSPWRLTAVIPALLLIYLNLQSRYRLVLLTNVSSGLKSVNLLHPPSLSCFRGKRGGGKTLVLYARLPRTEDA